MDKKMEQAARDCTAHTEIDDDLTTTFQRILLMLKRLRKK